MKRYGIIYLMLTEGQTLTGYSLRPDIIPDSPESGKCGASFIYLICLQ